MSEHDEAGRSLITVSRSDQFPPVCIECGNNTTRRANARAEPVEMPEDEGTLPQTVFSLVSPLGLMLSLFKKLATKTRYALGRGRWQVTIAVPQCPDCARRGRPEFLDVDYFQRTLALTVHPRFRRQLESSFGRRGRWRSWTGRRRG